MGIEKFDQNPKVENIKTREGIIKKLSEGMSTGSEGERTFTIEELVAAIKELDASAGEIEPTDLLIRHDGVLVSASLRAKGSNQGFSYTLKGKHGGTHRPRTIIDQIDYAGPDSDLVVFAIEIAEYKDGAWVK